MSRHSTRKSFDLEWVEHWARRVNEDRILAVIGRFFTGRFVLGVDETDYLIEVSRGRSNVLPKVLKQTTSASISPFEPRAAPGRNFLSQFRRRCSMTSGRWHTRCTSTCASKAIRFRSGRTCGR